MQSPLPYYVGWKKVTDRTHTQGEGIIQGHVHQEVGIMVVILKSVHHKTY